MAFGNNVSAAFVTAAFSIVLMGATAPPVPRAYLGAWAHGSCAKLDDRLVITATSAHFSTMRPENIYFDASRDGGEFGAVHWRREGDVDNFVYLEANDMLVHNTQGFHMPGVVAYKRCGPRPPRKR
ncbi:MAG: hypothetical protein M3R53_06630 [Candidatus Eremiobacteraeota bacterium]|nr:hypothetical protein [Candidatus Eremiobacteraeota bacterium]